MPNCTAPQHSYVLSLLEQIEVSKPYVHQEVRDSVDAVLAEFKALPWLRGQEYERVDRATTSKTIDGLKVISDNLKQLAAQNLRASADALLKQEYPGIPNVTSVMVTRFSGNPCFKCGIATDRNSGDLYVTFRNGSRKPCCLACATGKEIEDPTTANEARKELKGLHKVDHKLYRVNEDGSINYRDGRAWKKTTRDPGLSKWTLITEERAQTYGLETGKCINCGEPIGAGQSRKSLAMGYGPYCAKQYGWYFPKSEEEAERILANRIKKEQQ